MAKLKQKKNEEEKQRSTQEKEKEELRVKEMSAENYYLTWLEEKVRTCSKIAILFQHLAFDSHKSSF